MRTKQVVMLIGDQEAGQEEYMANNNKDITDTKTEPCAQTQHKDTLNNDKTERTVEEDPWQIQLHSSVSENKPVILLILLENELL